MACPSIPSSPGALVRLQQGVWRHRWPAALPPRSTALASRHTVGCNAPCQEIEGGHEPTLLRPAIGPDTMTDFLDEDFVNEYLDYYRVELTSPFCETT